MIGKSFTADQLRKCLNYVSEKTTTVNLSALKTENKTSLVTAVNELSDASKALDRDKAKVSRGVILYVSPSGNDVTGDGSQSNPFATLEHALDTLGDVSLDDCMIYLKEGTYNITCTKGRRYDHVYLISTIPVTIIGDGPDKTILNVTGAYYNDFIFWTANNTFIYNITINYTPVSTRLQYILTTFTGKSVFSNVHINVLKNIGENIAFYSCRSELNVTACCVSAVENNSSVTALYVAEYGYTILNSTKATPQGRYAAKYGNVVKVGGRVIKKAGVSWGAYSVEDQNNGGIIETF